MSDINEYYMELKRQQRDSQDGQLNQMLGSVGLDSTGAIIPGWTPPEKVAPAPKESVNPFVQSTQDLLLGYRESAAGAYSTMANAFGLIDKAAEKISSWTGLPKGGAVAGLIEPFLRKAAETVKPTEADFAGRDQFVNYLYRAVGAAPVTIGEYVAGSHVTGSGIAGMALIDALRASDKGAWETIKAGFQGALMGTALKAIEPFSRPVRAAAGALGFGGLAAVEGQPAAAVVAQAAVGGGIAALGETRTPEATKPAEFVPPKGVDVNSPIYKQALAEWEQKLGLQSETPTVEPVKPISKRDIIRQPDLTTKAAPIEAPDLTKPFEAQPDPVKMQLEAEMASAQIEADHFIREKGIGAVLGGVKRNTTNTAVRAAADAALQKANDVAQHGTVDEQVATPEMQTVFHGSAQVFDEFSMEHIGTGEGAQAYGHGLYFSENPKVAGEYKYRVGGDFAPGGKEELAKAWGELEKVTSSTNDPKILARAQKAYQAVVDKTANESGVMYEAKIPKEHIDKMLNWDKPLKEQPPAVQEALKQVGAKTFRLNPDMTGEQYYHALMREMEDPQHPNPVQDAADASELLNKKGISGVRYLDQGSRGAGKGTSNYVVFYPKILTDVKRNGEPIVKGPSDAEVSAKIEQAAQELQIQPQSIINTAKAVDAAKNGDKDFAKIVKQANKFIASQKGFSTFDVNFALARTLSGAIYGFTQGDDMEERIKNALLYGGLAALANPKMIRTIIQTVRGIDPRGIAGVEARDQGMTPTIADSFSSKGVDAKGMQDFLKMTNEGLDVQGRIQGINYDHINTPMDVKYVIGKMAKVYQDELAKVRNLGVTHEETIAAAKKLQGTDVLQWPDGKPMTDPELLLTRMVRNDLGLGLKDNTTKYLADPSQENLVSFIDNFNRYRMVQSVYGGQASGRGRGLEALKIDVGNSGEVEFHRMLGDVVESVDPTGWTPQRLAGAIAQVPDLESLNRAVDIATRPGMHDMALEAFYGVSMLSNPKTLVVNEIGTPLAMAWQVVKRSIAGASTVAMGKTGDPAYVQPVEPLIMLSAIKDSFHDAFTVAKRAFDTGERQYPHGGGKQAFARPSAITYDNLKAVYPKAFGAAESTLENMGIDAQKLKYGIDLLGSAARVSTRLMLATDEYNELIGTRMELYARSARSSAAEGLSFVEQRALAQEKIRNLEGMSSADKQAGRDFALYNSFNQEPGSITRRITGMIEALNKSPDIDPVWYLATKAVVPFVTIPSNIARWAARESGPTAFLSRTLKEQMVKGGAEAQMAWAGVALGSMVMTAAANMAMNGHLTGSAPTYKSDRLVWEADGNVEYAIKTPVGSFGINRLDPVSIPFAWAADFVNLAGHLDAYDSLTLTATAILTMTHDLASKNYVQGVTNFLHAITSMDSKELQNFVKGEAGALLVPGIIRGVRQETDPYRRATNTAFEAASANTPWGSTDYPPILDRFARPVYSGYGASQGWASLFSILNPIQYRAPNENRVIKEITDNKISIPGLSDTIFGAKDNPYDNKPPDSRTGVKLEGWEFYLYNKYSGEKLFELLSKEVEKSGWKAASPGPDGGKAMMFNTLVSVSDEYARRRLLGESPDLNVAMRERQRSRQEALRPGPGLQVPVTQGGNP